MKYLLAVVVFSAACALLFLAQRWAGEDAATGCDACDQPGCAARGTGSGPASPECPEDAQEPGRPDLG